MPEMRSTRICVKGLPKHVDEKRVREHFSSKGVVTDVKILRTGDGRSRQFGFVGFRTEDEAEAAMSYFNRTFVDTSRISVELALTVEDKNLARPWSRYSKGSAAFEKNEKRNQPAPEPAPEPLKARAAIKLKKSKHGRSDAEVEEDPMLKEFLEVMQPRHKKTLWGNDDATHLVMERKSVPAANGSKQLSQTHLKFQAKGKKKGGKKQQASGEDGEDTDMEESDSDEYEEADGADGEEDDESDSDGEDESDEEEVSEEDEAEKKVVKDAAVSDMDYLKSRATGSFDDDDDAFLNDGKDAGDVDNEDDEDEEDDEDDEDEDEDEDEEGEEEDEEEEGRGGGGGGRRARTWSMLRSGPRPAAPTQEAEEVGNTGRLYIRNLPYSTTEDELRDAFSPHGEISEVHIVKDRESGVSKGFAYVLFMLPEDANTAMEILDRSIFQGRLMHIMPAKAAPEAAPSDHPTIQRPGQSQFKQEREKQMKANANDKKSWNSLFMRADTVAAAVADRFGVTKSNLLDPEAGDAAVRLALGETHIIAETKQALSSEGVDVALLEAAASGQKEKTQRSSTTILVKNLPYDTTEADLRPLFERHGAIGRFVLPPTKTLALVEFLEGSDARHAFKALAFKRFGKVPLYLEWAPEGVLSGAAPSTNPKNEASAAAVKGVASAAVEEEEEADPNATDTTCTLFIRNLKFTTGNDAFTTHLRKVAPKGFMRAMVKTKTGKKGEVLSCGFGFATYRTRESAQVAVKLAQSSKLDGHTLTLELSQQRKQEAQAGPAEEKGGKKKNKGLSATKIIVRNLAFEATQRDLHQLFSPFGQIKSIRIPRKFDGGHRGFAFVEFVTKKEAANAFDAIKSTHLYGRHLVLEYAKAEEGLEDLRERTSQQFQGQGLKRPAEAGEAEGSAAQGKKGKRIKGNLDDAGKAFTSFMDL
ncbi:hypothetical protein CYMTET_8567 [Cymbomonas tetramitiformis]|uniref:RRM domain-containing protein n=1 Tax=Cymbomonas tetramitiformis TaxID=36881 RepID=A0AAE0GT72_9CHLO|nr:hypothetical protein CYMTET_8567 [Cymbomonas tetramitiformis]